MVIDSHQHFWVYSEATHGWIDETMGVLKRDFLPGNLNTLLKKQGVDGTVAVQAQQSLKENDFLLGHAHENDFVKGVVGWFDLAGNRLEEELDKYMESPFLKGVREITQGEPDEKYFSNHRFIEGARMAGEKGLTFDILIYHKQFKAATGLARLLDNQKLVLDHIGKPDIRNQDKSQWKKDIAELAKMDHVYCKLSGMVTEAAWQTWKYKDFEPYMQTVLEAFGTKRVMIGSDWPVCLLSGSYPEVWAIVSRFMSKLSISEQADIKGNNAVEFYSL